MTPSRLQAARAALAGLTLATGLAGPLALSRPAAAQDDGGVRTLTGEVTVTSPYIGRAFSQPFILLTDLTAFAERDLLMPLPSPVQVTGNLEGDFRETATFTIPLPIEPMGAPIDIDGEGPGTGVQAYAVDFQVNLVGDPFLSDLEMNGWPSALSSLEVETGTHEVIGGELVAWAPDGDQVFPTGFGPDGKLFTGDDPLGPIPAGWTVVDMNQEPFRQIRDAVVQVPILEGDIGLKDLSAMGWTEAFDALVDELALRYPFTEFKGIDWEALRERHRPAIEQAEQAKDAEAYNVALLRFASDIGDGHVTVDPPESLMVGRYGGDLGLKLGLTDDGAVVVRCVAPKGAAAKAGIEPGAEIVTWGGSSAQDALASVETVFSESTERGLLAQRLMLMARAAPGKKLEVSFANPGSETETATLKASKDVASLAAPCGAAGADPVEMPVTARTLPGGIGYLKVNSFSDDLTLILQSWEWALRRLRQLDAPALVIDLRDNGGGLTKLPVYMAGSFVDESFVLANQVFVDENGDSVVSGIDRIDPAPVRWKQPTAVLVGPDCVSACEIFAAALAEAPNVTVVGMAPTAGVEGGVFPWLLPEGIAFRAPLIGYETPDGEVFLEGTGVAPDVLVPSTAETLRLDPGTPDAVLAAAVAALAAPPAPAATPAP